MGPSEDKRESDSLTPEQLDDLRHMLGVGKHIRKRDWGFRNYFNSTPDSPDDKRMALLHDMGYVVPGARGSSNYWHCTALACMAVGLTEAQTKRALYGD